MDSRDILKELGEIRGSLIDDADPEKETDSAGRRRSRFGRKWIVRGIGAAAAAALVILAVRLSDGKLPVTDPAGTSGSETLTNEEAKQQVPDSNMQGEVKQSVEYVALVCLKTEMFAAFALLISALGEARIFFPNRLMVG